MKIEFTRPKSRRSRFFVLFAFFAFSPNADAIFPCRLSLLLLSPVRIRHAIQARQHRRAAGRTQEILDRYEGGREFMPESQFKSLLKRCPDAHCRERIVTSRYDDLIFDTPSVPQASTVIRLANLIDEPTLADRFLERHVRESGSVLSDTDKAALSAGAKIWGTRLLLAKQITHTEMRHSALLEALDHAPTENGARATQAMKVLEEERQVATLKFLLRLVNDVELSSDQEAIIRAADLKHCKLREALELSERTWDYKLHDEVLVNYASVEHDDGAPKDFIVLASATRSSENSETIVALAPLGKMSVSEVIELSGHTYHRAAFTALMRNFRRNHPTGLSADDLESLRIAERQAAFEGDPPKPPTDEVWYLGDGES